MMKLQSNKNMRIYNCILGLILIVNLVMLYFRWVKYNSWLGSLSNPYVEYLFFFCFVASIILVLLCFLNSQSKLIFLVSFISIILSSVVFYSPISEKILIRDDMILPLPPSEYGLFGREASALYGSVVSLEKWDSFMYPDFSISYSGMTKINTGHIDIQEYNFEITAPDNRKRKIIWSAGTGDISPTYFVVGDKMYQLERSVREKDNAKLADNQMVISESNGDVFDYIIRPLVAGYSSLWPKENLDDITKDLGFLFKKSQGKSNQYFDFYVSDGFGPFRNVDLLISKTDSQKKLLSFEIDPSTNISNKSIFTLYPKAILTVTEPNNQVHSYIKEKEQWGNISFGFNDKDVLTSIVFDSTEM